MKEPETMSTRINYRFLILFCASLLVGLLLAWIDTRPGWDDTGIEVGMILGSSFCFGFVQPRNAWLWATNVGLWVPLANFALHLHFASWIALLFSFTGVYAGVLIKKMMRAPVA